MCSVCDAMRFDAMLLRTDVMRRHHVGVRCRAMPCHASPVLSGLVRVECGPIQRRESQPPSMPVLVSFPDAQRQRRNAFRRRRLDAPRPCRFRPASRTLLPAKVHLLREGDGGVVVRQRPGRRRVGRRQVDARADETGWRWRRTATAPRPTSGSARSWCRPCRR